ncbi:AMP-binding protein [Parafrankia sp. BMG5.11]|uniref:AMP-binding protein n=1 Tax=Parafrankia sp. BMG5.11 TaxID=222540 RepID=UPI001A9CEC0A|nr:AMP-binding protein [Parafrankia sp. BMG5.11]
MTDTAVPAAPPTVEDPARIAEMAARGMLVSYWARQRGDAPAVLSPRGNRTYEELNANANRLVHLLRGAGLTAGSPVALLCGNIPQFIETVVACQRAGFRYTPINWHLAADEVAYILDDCDAEALVIEAQFLEKVAGAQTLLLKARLCVGGSAEGFADFDHGLLSQSGDDPADPVLGKSMLYTSGTTGRPKGVIKEGAPILLPQGEGTRANYQAGDVQLLCGPAYHAAPLAFDIAIPLASGAAVSMMERFDPAQALALIARQRVTHSHMVPTMFQRLLALPPEIKQRADTSSLRLVIHGAAPVTPEVKRAMIGWWGPIFYEYYASTEASANIGITSQEWLERPGSVGRLLPEFGACVLDEEGKPCAPGVPGQVSFRQPATGRVSYFKADEKNREVFSGDYYTVGDIGYVDQDGYLFLTGRSAETIISGGVNIYPQEIDNALQRHPAVRQSCTVGVPSVDWGEDVRGVVSLNPGYEPSQELTDALIAMARDTLAPYKVPREIDYLDDIPVSPAGKTERRKVRERYWQGRARAI